jgi:hypothetical protein
MPNENAAEYLANIISGLSEEERLQALNAALEIARQREAAVTAGTWSGGPTDAEGRRIDADAEPPKPAVPPLGDLKPPASSQPNVERGAELARVRHESQFGTTVGEPITFDQLGEAIVEQIYAQGGSPFVPNQADGTQKITVGRIDTRTLFDEDRYLDIGRDSDEQMNEKLDAVTAGAWRPERWKSYDESGLTASGGFCAVPQPDFDIPSASARTGRSLMHCRPSVRRGAKSSFSRRA